MHPQTIKLEPPPTPQPPSSLTSTNFTLHAQPQSNLPERASVATAQPASRDGALMQIAQTPVGELAKRRYQQLAQTYEQQQNQQQSRIDRVLDEDKWESALRTIVQRDFFPDLPRLKAEIALMQAEQNNDILLAEQARMELAALKQARKECKKQRHGAASAASTPSVASTPLARGNDDSYSSYLMQLLREEAHDSTQSSLTQDKSLDSFFAQHTSEDNESFSEIARRMHERHQRKLQHFYILKGKPNADDLVRPDVSMVRHDVPALAHPKPMLHLVDKSVSGSTSLALESKQQDRLLSITDRSTATVEESQKVADQQAPSSSISDSKYALVPSVSTNSPPFAMPQLAPEQQSAKESWTKRPMVLNAVMFVPQTGASTKSEARGMPPPKIRRHNTRLRSTSSSISGASSDVHSTTSSQLQAIKSKQLSDNAYQLEHVSEQLLKRGSTAIGELDAADTIHGYDLVPNTPSLPSGSSTPIMTWGTTAGTPLVLSGQSTPSFRMQPVSQREQLMHKLASSSEISKKSSGTPLLSGSGTPFGGARTPAARTPGATERLEKMSSAAQKLAAKVVPGAGRSTPLFGSSFGASTPSSSSTPLGLAGQKRKPQQQQQEQSSEKYKRPKR